MRTIPRAPARLRLPIERLWNGASCDLPIRGAVELGVLGDALLLRASPAQPGAPRVPGAPPGTRVDGLWAYDVVECFLVGAGGRYLELELGAAGHWLALSFAAPRVRADAHETLALAVEHGREPGGWWARVALPLAVLPPGLCAANAFAIAGGRFLAHHPLPGATPDFHQPATFPLLTKGSDPVVETRPGGGNQA
jgi:hypothetical protein